MAFVIVSVFVDSRERKRNVVGRAFSQFDE
ncbi:hypothetical protein IMSAGC007_02940 [Lachnospiraceae bacterium]|nr:hypothetical protein IMSAGC007_02940 [Lachnospiraceae bacterium]